MRHQ
jgi:hypothetical protein